MEPVTTAAAAATSVIANGGDISGLLEIAQSFSRAAGEGNYWWVISMSVFCLLELAKGRVPGTKIVIPQIPHLLDQNMSAQVKQILVMGLSAVLAVIFVLAGRSVDAAVADFAQGWIGAMGLHNAAGMVRGFLPKKDNG